jgi:hypothetical protein
MILDLSIGISVERPEKVGGYLYIGYMGLLRLILRGIVQVSFSLGVTGA